MPNDRTVKGPGYQLIIATGSVSKKVEQAILDGLAKAGDIYLEEVDKVTDLTDHDLNELRKLGHPYAVEAEARGVPPVHKDDRLLHEQSGYLKLSMGLNAIKQTARRFSQVITSRAPYLAWLIAGTQTMRPRRFHELAYLRGRTKIWAPLKQALKGVRHRIVLKG
jgi:hypothetical protein